MMIEISHGSYFLKHIKLSEIFILVNDQRYLLNSILLAFQSMNNMIDLTKASLTDFILNLKSVFEFHILKVNSSLRHRFSISGPNTVFLDHRVKLIFDLFEHIPGKKLRKRKILLNIIHTVIPLSSLV